MNDTLQIAAPAGANLQAALAIDTTIADIFDRYADGIIGSNRQMYDSFEVHGVRNFATAIEDGTHYEIDNINPTLFSVYAHIEGGGVECVGDFTRYTDATTYGMELSSEYNWPLRNFVLEQHRMSTLANLQ
jgi:hypothetical protein